MRFVIEYGQGYYSYLSAYYKKFNILKFCIAKYKYFAYNMIVNGTWCGRKLTNFREFFLYLVF